MASVRLPDHLSHKEKLKRVDEVVETLGLTKCIDTGKFTFIIIR